MYRQLCALTICLLLVNCGNSENTELLVRLADIQVMGDSCPQKAISRLDSIRSQCENEGEYVRNKFDLLDIRLHDKAYIAHTSDSKIKQVCQYFDEYGSNKEKQEAYYYMGSVYRDLNDFPRAVTNYLKAIEIAERCEDYNPAILELSCMQLSGLYRLQFNNKEALEISLKGLAVAEKHNLADERTYMDVANAYLKSKVDTFAAKKLFKLAFDRIKGNAFNSVNADVAANLMGVFSYLDDKQIADTCYFLLQQLSTNEMPKNYLINLANYQEKYLSADSAVITILELFDSAVNGVTSIYNASNWLTRYYAKKGQHELACKYAINFIEANEKIIKERDFGHTANAKNIFQYQRDKDEEQRIMLENEKKGRTVIITISLSVIIILLMITFYFMRSKQVLARLIDMNCRIDALKSDIAHKETILKKKEEEAESRSKELYEMNEMIVTLDRQRSVLEQTIKEQMQQNNDLLRMLLLREMESEDSEIVLLFKEAAAGLRRVGKDEWRRLYAAVNKKYPGFKEELQQKLARINDVTLQLCYLLKIGFTNKEIENVTSWAHQTVWYRVKRIERIMQTGIDSGTLK